MLFNCFTVGMPEWSDHCRFGINQSAFEGCRFPTFITWPHLRQWVMIIALQPPLSIYRDGRYCQYWRSEHTSPARQWTMLSTWRLYAQGIQKASCLHRASERIKMLWSTGWTDMHHNTIRLTLVLTSRSNCLTHLPLSQTFLVFLGSVAFGQLR